jgi:hypothetical protein
MNMPKPMRPLSYRSSLNYCTIHPSGCILIRRPILQGQVLQPRQHQFPLESLREHILIGWYERLDTTRRMP